MWEINMSSSADNFWRVVEGWATSTRRPRIRVELTTTSPPLAADWFEGTVRDFVRGVRITFQTAENGDVRELSLKDAEIRPAGFSRDDAVSSFAIAWDGEGLEFLRCVLTETRTFGEPN
jgi:hypothetical protein